MEEEDLIQRRSRCASNICFPRESKMNAQTHDARSFVCLYVASYVRRDFLFIFKPTKMSVSLPQTGCTNILFDSVYENISVKIKKKKIWHMVYSA